MPASNNVELLRQENPDERIQQLKLSLDSLHIPNELQYETIFALRPDMASTNAQARISLNEFYIKVRRGRELDALKMLLSDDIKGAAREGYTEVVKYFHVNGIQITDHVIIAASVGGHYKSLDYCIRHKVDVFDDTMGVVLIQIGLAVFQSFGETKLKANKAIEIIEYLESQGLVFNENTALSVSGGHHEILKHFHDNGLVFGDGAMDYVWNKWSFEGISYLQSLGLEFRGTFLQVSAYDRHRTLASSVRGAEFLKRYGGLIEGDMIRAIDIQDLPLVKYLHENGILFNWRIFNQAMIFPQVNIVKYILSDIEIDENIIYRVVASGNFLILRSVEERITIKPTKEIVKAAVLPQNIEMLEYILSLGDIELTSELTAFALQYGTLDAVKMLIERYAPFPMTPMDHIKFGWGNTDYIAKIEYLAEEGFRIKSGFLLHLIFQQDYEAIIRLLSIGTEINESDFTDTWTIEDPMNFDYAMYRLHPDYAEEVKRRIIDGKLKSIDFICALDEVRKSRGE